MAKLCIAQLRHPETVTIASLPLLNKEQIFFVPLCVFRQELEIVQIAQMPSQAN